MLIFIENRPRAYAWGSNDALPKWLGVAPNGEPQAELWLGSHPGAPAQVAKATPEQHTLLDLIEADPDRYGVNGKQLPFLLKVLAIGGPLSLQVHPDLEQARAGFAREEALGIPDDAPQRNYGDPNHKPELLVALTEVTALCGFRALGEARDDLRALAAALPAGAERDALSDVASRQAPTPERARGDLLAWALRGGADVDAAVAAIHTAVSQSDVDLSPLRLQTLRNLIAAYPGDPGILVSLLLHLVRLQPGEATYLGARQLHAYLGGLAVEVMAASDNVLRAGLTPKHVDADELLRITDVSELAEPRFAAERRARGLVAWQPPVPDFVLMRATLCGPDQDENDSGRIVLDPQEAAESITIEALFPLVLLVTSGRVRVERRGEIGEVANARRGQSLYISAGEPLELSGQGEAFIATVGEDWR